MNKKEERVTINEPDKAENTIRLLINTDIKLFCFQVIRMLLCTKWIKAYDYQIYVVIVMFIVSR